MTDLTLISGQVIGVIGSVIGFVAVAIVFWRLGMSRLWVAAALLLPLALGAFGTFYAAARAAEGDLSVDSYYLVLRFREWLLPVLIAVIALSRWPRMH